MAYQKLFTLGPPSFLVAVLDDSGFADLQLQLAATYSGAVLRRIRSEKSTTVSAFFDEVSAALQFPYYFGYNWDAFDECMSDLDWIEGDVYLFFVTRATLLLRDADAEDFRILLQTWERANREWVTPNQYIPRNRPPTPMHFVLQCAEADTAELSRRFQEVGMRFERL